MARTTQARAAPLPPLAIHPLTPERWADFEALMGPQGGHGGCWCMWWRVPNRTYDAGAGNHDAFHALVHGGTPSGTPTGLLAYEGETPVGWISLGPRADFRRFPSMTSTHFRSPDAQPVWSIVCFYVAATMRRQGVAKQLLARAIEWARAQGAPQLEAYPVPNDHKGSAMTYFMGTEALYAAAGFVEVAHNSPKRLIMRLDLLSAHTAQPAASA